MLLKVAKVFKSEGINGLAHRIRGRLNRIKSIIFQPIHEKQLDRIIAAGIKNCKELIIYPPTVAWDIALFQRPQHLALKLAKLGYLFFYSVDNHFYESINSFEAKMKNLFLTDRYDLLVKKLTAGWILVSSTNQLVTTEDIKKYKSMGFRIIYDYIDEIHSDITGNIDKIEERHKFIDGNTIDLVLTSASELYNEMVMRFPKERILLLPNGAEYDHFHIKKDAKRCPRGMRKILAEMRPIIGYYGALAKWIDYNLINFVAEKRPDWNLVIIGVDYDGSVKALKKISNIKYLGWKNYNELPEYAIWFDVAMIPFAEGDIAKSTSPIKLFEYMAMNKPIVVTKDLLECYKYEGVLIAKDKDDFVDKIEEAYKLKDDPDYINILDQQARENTWESRALEIDTYMNNYINWYNK